MGNTSLDPTGSESIYGRTAEEELSSPRLQSYQAMTPGSHIDPGIFSITLSIRDVKKVKDSFFAFTPKIRGRQAGGNFWGRRNIG